MHKNKRLDMIRSILPSTTKVPGMLKALRKRAHRRAIHEELHTEDYETTKADLLRDIRVGDLVAWRRGGDKLNHFMRWCEALTKGMSREDALSYVRALLPPSLIGDHAYSHWDAHLRPRRPFHYVSFEKRQQSFVDSTAFRLHRALRADPSLHARLNAAIKATRTEDQPRRLLLGIHDVEEFVRDIFLCCEQRITLELIEAIEKGGLKAALRVSLQS